MRHSLLLIILFSAIIGSTSNASIKIFFGTGLGSSSSSNESTQTEGPLVQVYRLEALQHSKLSVGTEHIRSLALSPMSTAVALTGIYFNYYFSTAPTPYYSAEEQPVQQIVQRNFGIYLGTGLGLAQSSRLPDSSGKSSNAAGIYLSPKVGSDYQLSKSIGVRGELLTGMLVMGQGSIQVMGLIGSVYWIF